MLRDFGLGKTSMESLILKEVETFNEVLKQEKGRAMNMRHRFNISVVNALWTLISGKRLPLDDPELLGLVDIMDKLTVDAGKQKAIDGFPWLRFIAPKLSGWVEIQNVMTTLLGFIERTMMPHVSSFNTEGKKYLTAFTIILV